MQATPYPHVVISFTLQSYNNNNLLCILLYSFMVAKDAHWCTNKHLFCAACIYAWSMTGEGNTDRCPVCRVRGSYCEEDSINARINNMAIK